MKAIAICGSPRANGNTELLLTRCLAKLEGNGISTELVRLHGKTIRGCTACGACRKRQDGNCAITDDDFAEVFEAMKAADIIVVGSPVYYGSAVPEMMAVLDRAGFVSGSVGNKFFSRKIGGPIVVARRAGQNFTFAQLMYWFMINDMIVPGSSYWNIAFGLQPGEVANDEEGLATVDRFAENLSWLAEKVGG
jgi:multimeric flavodoxin WrbA